MFKEGIDLGCFTEQATKPCRVQPIGTIPEKGTDFLRSITDWNRPFSCPVNTLIHAETVTLESIDDAVFLSEPSCFFDSVDIKSAYQGVPVYPQHRQLQGFCWAFDGESSRYYVDNFLCFGLPNASSIFHRVSRATTRNIRRNGFRIVSYFDDFCWSALVRQNAWQLNVPRSTLWYNLVLHHLKKTSASYSAHSVSGVDIWF